MLFFSISKECAKLGWAIITAHLWVSWHEIVHFPSEIICRPIIRIILGKPEYPVVTASSESIWHCHRSCPEPKQWHHSVTWTQKWFCVTFLYLSPVPWIKLWNNNRKPLSTFGLLLGRDYEHVLLVYCLVTLLSFVCNKMSQNKSYSSTQCAA